MPVSTYRASVPGFGEGATPNPLASRRAEQVNLPFYAQWGLEGRIFSVNMGVESTGVAMTNTVIDEDQSEITVRVPTGTTIIPLYARIVMETSQNTTTYEYAFATAANDVGAGATALTPVNMLATGGKATNCLVTSAATSNQTAATRILYLAHVTHIVGTATNLDTNSVRPVALEWSILQRPDIPVLNGPASFLGYAAGSTSSNVFIVVSWAEFLTSELGL